MPQPISAKADKTLGNSFAFERLKGQLPPSYADLFLPQPEEECIGIYHNEGGKEEPILITSLGLHLSVHGTVTFVPYSSISRIKWLEPDKILTGIDPNKQVLILDLLDGSIVECPVRGKWYDSQINMGGPDIANFHTFLLGAKLIREIEERKQGLS